MKFPPQVNLLDAMTSVVRRYKRAAPPFCGMKPDLKSDPWFREISFCQPPYLFDGDFESGNLDTVYMTARREFNLLMRVDSNCRGNH